MRNRIGIRREDKNPWEKRTPLIPSHVGELIRKYSLKISIQPSAIRIFPDEDYTREGVVVEENLSSCPVIFAVKEIPVHLFEKEKIYIFFSHTIKGQSSNMSMLKRMKELRCTLIDYEKIVDENGFRLVFFGKQAGQAGMIDTLWALGQRLNFEKTNNPFSSLRQTCFYKSLVEAKEEVEKVGWRINKEGLDPSLMPFVCGFTGYGKVSQGAQELFDLLPMEEVLPEHFQSFMDKKNFSSNKAYKVVFKEQHMVEPISSSSLFDLQDYYDYPGKYRANFERYIPFLTLLVNCIYWAPQYPRFVTKKLLKQLWVSFSPLPALKVIGDISCDVNGSIECTERATHPDRPVFVYDPITEVVTDGIEGRGVVVMAIDNLPAEIPLESSLFFSAALKPFIPGISAANFSGDFNSCQLPDAVKKAVILYKGDFTQDYEYMKEFIK